MAAGVQLQQLVVDLRAECGMSLNPAHGVGNTDAHKYALRRMQEELYVSHDWPRLVIERDVPVLVGERYYDYPADLDFNFINAAWVKSAAMWVPVIYGIQPDDLNAYNSDDDFRADPPLKWQHYADGDNDNQFQVWPVPAGTTSIRFRGRQRLKPFVEDDDVCTLDGTLLVLYTAAEILARLKSEDAQFKLERARQYNRMLKARQGAAKSEPMVIGGGGPSHVGRPGIDFIPPGYGNGS